eukprot:CAMPEP_0114623476 /NCGR_PEP_ID=MMETSP0168-20121206/10272_1 /TAXON_ID=95228 ORGANISM="Vannella sp., Strain DIVA3 517/6/12" /NCGR_SAMPLE_ID=MMETSP0168 /ASSEMBLY_ACC=CAM_ASM_000044 /LENGTH=100 /DNA_ID=CAMNT_0001834723 /DNA_START=126 /DNA_END=429 /DNA_ORIENTATION=+
MKDRFARPSAVLNACFAGRFRAAGTALSPTGCARCIVTGVVPRAGLVESAAAPEGIRPLLQAYVAAVVCYEPYLGYMAIERATPTGARVVPPRQRSEPVP